MKFNIIRLMVTLAVVGALIATLSACRPIGAPDPTPAPKPLQSGSQRGGEPPLQQPWGLLARCTDPAGSALDSECLELLRKRVGVCEYEDGSLTGEPCLWTDPDGTGVYYVETDG
jgi:hypothetical protein